MKALRLPIIVTLIAICLCFAVVALVEGTASIGLFVLAMRDAHFVEEHFTERDTLLGWINAPNTYKPNLFGPGRSLRINGQRFRHSGELAAVPPAGKKRVVCSGDSFTLGYGVDDTKTWCALLAADAASLETVNMGQAGYGIDQAYLWYVRDGLPLHPQVHVFALITDDFRRMQIDRFGGFPKPRLALNRGSLRTVGVPVPTPGLGPFKTRLLTTTRTLRSFALLERLSIGRDKSSSAASALAASSATWDVARAVLRDMAVRDSIAGAKLIVVYLPTIDEFKGKGADNWRHSIHDVAGKDNYEFVDLVEALRHVSPDSVDRLFIPRGRLAFMGAAGHYTEAGNLWVENNLRTRMPILAGR